jgi:DnaJ-class molecular chaperone
MANQIKVTCTRCGGSGSYSFNLSRGTVCFGCNGAGSKVVDSAKHAKAQAKRAADKAKTEAQRDMRARIAAELHAEMNAKFGPFPDDMKGSYDLMCAVRQATGMTIGDMVNQRLAA